MKPYFETKRGRLFHGDCLEVMRELDIKADLCLTDPPYGIGDKWVGGKGHGWGTQKEQGDKRNSWDSVAPQKEIDFIIKETTNQIIWGGNYFNVPPSRCWLVWNKPERGFSLAEAELAWTSFDKLVRVKDLPRYCSDKQHPTQKPVELMKWCLKNYSKENDLILDPFFGSGTTGVACELMNRRWIGIELDEEYCEIAARRIEEASKQHSLFE